MRYEYASWQSDVGHCQPGAHALIAYAAVHGFGDNGCWNDRAVRGSTAPSLHREGRAVDLVPGDRSDDDLTALVDLLVWHHEDLGIQQVIWRRAYWRCDKDSWRAYGGINPHDDHAHIELTWHASANNTVDTYLRVLAPTPRKRLATMFIWDCNENGDGRLVPYLWDGEKVVPLTGTPVLHFGLATSGQVPYAGVMSRAEHDLAISRLASPNPGWAG